MFHHQTTLTLLGLVFFAFAGGCTTDTANPNPQNTVNAGDAAWKVTWYWDKDKDETSDFVQYTFYFRSNGAFDASAAGVASPGTWQIITDDGVQKLVLMTATSKPLSSLADKWVILESNDLRIRLMDDNPTHTEELNFERVQ